MCGLLLCNTMLFAQTKYREANFKGGQKAMAAYIKKNLLYPQVATKNHTEGKCFLKFVVSKDGTITHVAVVQGVANCPECDQEAIRVLKNMPKWKPAKENGQKVSSYFTIPINFTLD